MLRETWRWQELIFKKAVKEIYAIEDDKEVKPAMEYKEYDVGEKPEGFDFQKK